MSVSLQYLEHCAAETGYAVATLEKVTRLGEIAAEIARDQLLGTALALKGGTALNLCFGNAPTRMSVDLDYNYIAHAEREKMLVDRPEVEAAVERIVQRLGHRVQRSADAAGGRKLYATYRSVLGTDERVEVDLNYLFRMPLDGIMQAEMWQPGELDRPQIRVVSLLELSIGKLLAMLDRAAARDAWDAARLPQIASEVLKSARFRALFVGMSVILVHPMNTYTRERMKQLLTQQVIESQLIPMLASTSPPGAEALIDEAWRVVAPCVELSPNEAEYVAAAQRGELRPELLTPEQPELVALLSNHPAIRWKVDNARQRQARRG